MSNHVHLACHTANSIPRTAQYVVASEIGGAAYRALRAVTNGMLSLVDLICHWLWRWTRVPNSRCKRRVRSVEHMQHYQVALTKINTLPFLYSYQTGLLLLLCVLDSHTTTNLPSCSNAGRLGLNFRYLSHLPHLPLLHSADGIRSLSDHSMDM